MACGYKIIADEKATSHFIVINEGNNIIFEILHSAKLQKLKENFKVIYFEDAAVADFAALAGGKQLDVAPTSVKIVSQGDAVSQFEDRAVGFAVGRFACGIAHRLSADMR